MHMAHVSVASLPVLYAFGGAVQRRIVEVAKQQARAGHHVVIYSVGDHNQTRHVDGVEVRYIRCRTRTPWRQIELQVRAIAHLHRYAPDVVHFHGQPEGALVSARLGAKTFLSFDNFYFRRANTPALQQVYRRMLTRFDGLLPCSQYCLEQSARYWHIAPDRMHVVYNGVNLQQFRPDPALQTAQRHAHGITKRVVLYVGRICRQKGSDVLLHAWEHLARTRHDVQLVMAGPIGQFGSTHDPERWAERINAAGGLYLGAVDEAQLNATYNLGDVYVMPTRELEMFGMAAVEAQACGKPVIASDHGGLRETVPDRCGARFPLENATALADQIAALLDDPARYAACSQHALQNAARYDWPVICRELDAVYAMGKLSMEPTTA